MNKDLADLCVGPEATLHRAIEMIDKNRRGIVLVTDSRDRLLGTVNDGDIRRAMLAGLSLETPLTELLARKAASPYPKPVTARQGASREELLGLMKERQVRQVPLLDEAGRLVDLVLLSDLIPEAKLPVRAVIMAGGRGDRLRPMTDDLPKPMLPVGDKPLMERIISRLRESGVRRVTVTTHFLPEKITEHFGDGSRFGVEVNYLAEDQPLGTAGALAYLEPAREPLLIINGDILTLVDFRAMLAFHQEQRAALTVGVRRYQLKVPFGVLTCEGSRIKAVKEKPEETFFVNAGVYLLEPEAVALIPKGQALDMPDLIQLCLGQGLKVVGFPIREYWLDIGQHEDYARAQEDARNGRLDP